MNEHAWGWAETLGHWALAWTFVVVAVGLGMRLGRPRRSSVRYAAWLLATFAGLALMPLIVGLGPRVSWHDALAFVRRPPGPAATTEPVVRFRSWFEGMPAVASEIPHTEPRDPVGAAQVSLESPRTQGPGSSAGGRPEARGVRWLGVALAIWAAGFLGFAVRLGREALRVRALLAAATGEPPAGLSADLEPARLDLGLRRRVRVLVHAGIPAPICVGLLRPTLLWPTAENCPMTPSQRRASLVHELAHLRHGDDWVALLAEVWRCVSWFYLPVHVLLGRLRLEREFRCDDAASSRCEGSDGYALWLLDLAPVRVAPPAIASSLLGSADLATRVRRLLDRDARSAGPLSRRQALMLGAVGVALLGAGGSVRLVGFVANAVEAGPADAPLPEIAPEALAAKIEAARKDYQAGLLEVEFDEEWDATPVHRREIDPPAIRKLPGRFQHASDGRLWRAEFDAMTLWYQPKVVTAPRRWVTGFDGERHYEWKVGRGNEVTFGDSNREALTLEPRALFWYKHEEMINHLKRRDVTISQKTVDGVRCYLIQSRAQNDLGKWLSEYVISPRRYYLGVETSYFLNGQRYLSHRLRDVRQAEQGRWVPGRIDSESLNIRKDGSSRLTSRRVMRVVRYEPAKAIARESFALKLPLNAVVNDLTSGSQYVNDPWWPEVGRLLRERFNWPPPDLSRLQRLQSHCDGKIEGRPVPPVEASLWLNSGPIDWAQYRGKVVLIHFTSLFEERANAAAVRTLADLYEKAGLRAVSIVGSKEDPDAVRQYVEELQLKHPVAIDRPKGDRFGATMQAFGMSYETSVFLVDHLGKVRQVKQPDGLVELVVRLLREAGAKEVSTPFLGFPQFEREQRDAVDRAFQDWLKQADDGGSLVGTVVDGNGRPVANAQIRLRAETRILMGPNASFVISSRSPRTAITGENGLFQFLNLCKGNYDLQISAPGFAAIERKAVIEPTPGEVTFEAVLGQADTLGGRIVDEQGKPIADAEVTISERRLAHGDGTVTSFNGFLEMKTTDAQGRFQFRKLPEGDYTLTIGGTGFSKEVVKNVSAGANNLDLTLRRARP